MYGETQGYTLNRHYVRELVHVIDGKRVFDPKMPVEHDATVFANQSELTSKMLQDMITDAHVPADQMKELSLLSGARACARVSARILWNLGLNVRLLCCTTERGLNRRLTNAVGRALRVNTQQGKNGNENNGLSFRKCQKQFCCQKSAISCRFDSARSTGPATWQ